MSPAMRSIHRGTASNSCSRNDGCHTDISRSARAPHQEQQRRRSERLPHRRSAARRSARQGSPRQDAGARHPDTRRPPRSRSAPPTSAARRRNEPRQPIRRHGRRDRPIGLAAEHGGRTRSRDRPSTRRPRDSIRGRSFSSAATASRRIVEPLEGCRRSGGSAVSTPRSPRGYSRRCTGRSRRTTGRERAGDTRRSCPAMTTRAWRQNSRAVRTRLPRFLVVTPPATPLAPHADSGARRGIAAARVARSRSDTTFAAAAGRLTMRRPPLARRTTVDRRSTPRAIRRPAAVRL